MEHTMNMKRAAGYTSAVAIALALSTAYADDTTTSKTNPSAANTQSSSSMTGKEKATAIGAGTGAVAGAVVGGPVGAVVGAGLGGVVGHEGTDANGKIRDHDRNASNTSMSQGDDTVRKAQAALNDQGFNAGVVDGQMGPNTDSAIRTFQAKNGLSQSGTLDSATLNALGVSK
jgi:Putative peptidoglycan binding domain